MPPVPSPEGQRVFAEACQFCHGLRGEGGHNGMPLEGLAAFSTRYVANIVTDGQNNMPSFAASYSAEQIRAVAEHVRSLNPGIPNRNSR
jgi:mono/diheme cytochrome c family protein